MAVVVDSAASLPIDRDADAPILVPMLVLIGGQTYRDGVDLTPAQLYRTISEGSATPTTAAPSPQAFYEALTQAAQRANSVLCITVARRFSTAYDSAVLAAELARGRHPGLEVSVLDCGSAAGGEGLVTLAAQRSAATGATLPEVESAARDAASGVRLVAYVDTMYYLWRGGRVPGIAHAGASLLSIKPIFELANGRISRKMPARTLRSARRRLLKMVAKGVGGRPVTVCVMHAGVPEVAAAVEDALSDTIDCREIYVAEFSAVMGTHIGPGALGVAYAPA